MKQFSAILLSAALLFALPGCGGGAQDTDSVPETPEVSPCQEELPDETPEVSPSFDDTGVEKPVIYLYPEGEPADEKPVIYLYPDERMDPEKPAVYLYPEEGTEITVALDLDGTLTSTYPAYNDGWTVTAAPDGTLTDPATGRQYYCLFWEGITQARYDFSTGFCVAGEDTAAFLENALGQLGLTDREADEFIIYWLPRMEGNAYNLISFQGEAYTDSAVLTIDPAPDSLLRVFMAWKGLDAPVEIAPQELPNFERTGFTVVEWGGAEVSK